MQLIGTLVTATAIQHIALHRARCKDAGWETGSRKVDLREKLCLCPVVIVGYSIKIWRPATPDTSYHTVMATVFCIISTFQIPKLIQKKAAVWHFLSLLAQAVLNSQFPWPLRPVNVLIISKQNESLYNLLPIIVYYKLS